MTRLFNSPFGVWWQLRDRVAELSKISDKLIKGGMGLDLHPLEKTIAQIGGLKIERRF
jgi:hypothetical protein